MPDETPAQDEHLRPDQLYSLLYAIHQQGAPPAEGEGADPEVARALRDLREQLAQPLAAEHRLGPETVARLREHTAACRACRNLLVEDGPFARPPRTRADVQSDAQRAEAQRKRKVVKFFVDVGLGGSALTGAIALRYIRDRRAMEQVDPAGATLQGDPRDQARHVDPLLMGIIACVLVASWFLAEAYTIARELWIDFTAWKRAVPVIGKKWAERSKR